MDLGLKILRKLESSLNEGGSNFWITGSSKAKRLAFDKFCQAWAAHYSSDTAKRARGERTSDDLMSLFADTFREDLSAKSQMESARP